MICLLACLLSCLTFICLWFYFKIFIVPKKKFIFYQYKKLFCLLSVDVNIYIIYMCINKRITLSRWSIIWIICLNNCCFYNIYLRHCNIQNKICLHFRSIYSIVYLILFKTKFYFRHDFLFIFVGSIFNNNFCQKK